MRLTNEVIAITLRAFAKINLLLDVTGRLPSGYHSVEMLLQSVSLCDYVTMERTAGTGIEIHCSRADIPADQRNIAWKAVKAFEQALQLDTGGLRIAIEKHIPAQAGLGGGSADAAAVLTALRTMFHPQLPGEALLAIGAQVGADVPFCLLGGCCLVQGIGEVLAPLPCLPASYEIALCKPAAGVSTAQAYAAIDKSELRHPNAAKAAQCIRQEDWESVFPLCENVFEQVIALPELAQYKQACMRRGAKMAQMTGSGSAVFSIWEQAPPQHTGMQGEIFRCIPAPKGVEILS